MSLPAAYFDRLYAEREDPFGFADRWYEQRKYSVTMASLPQRRYRRAFEPGCSIGVLTEALAARCDRLLASDVSPAAVERARRRLSAYPDVVVEQRQVPDDWPGGRFDLVLLSELVYYFDDADLERLLALATGAVDDGGTLVAVHWRHPADDHRRSGDEVQGLLATAAQEAGLVETVLHVEADFRLGVWVRPQPGESPSRMSVAGREGLL
jgi:predicted TPR repeat methyltransferase